MKKLLAPAKRLVLAGGGHAHVLVLEAFAERPAEGVELILVAKDLRTPYSGMLPGHVAGLYSRAAMHIDLEWLARRAGARLVHGAAAAFEPLTRQVLLEHGDPIPYDVLSIDIGITPDLSAVAGAADHAIAVKPIGDFLEKWDLVRESALRSDGPRQVAVVGGGLAGLCLAFAAAATLRRGAGHVGLDPAAFQIALVSAAETPDLNPAMRRLVRRALASRRIDLHEDHRAIAIDPEGVVLASGRRIPSDVVLLATHAAPPAAVQASALAKDRHGFLALEPTLQVINEADVFAAGDCATMLAHPRPKAGVYAVRQGPVLADNLRRKLRGEPLRDFEPQKRHLVLLSTGDGRAIGGRGRWLAFEGRHAWWLKDWIDRRFMRRFEEPRVSSSRCRARS